VGDGVGGLRAFAHPVRLRMLSLLRGRELSATQLAGELGIAHGSASYHLRQLASAGLVELAEQRVRRGGKERTFRLAHPPGLRGFDQQDRREFAESALVEARRRLAFADLAQPSTVGDAEVWLDLAVWAELVERARQLMSEMSSRAQPARTPGTRPVSMTVLWFALADRDQNLDGPDDDG
jgi:DNA-binding transcriptional ArsR family regulator